MLAVDRFRMCVVEIVSITPSEKGYRINIRGKDDYIYVKNPPLRFAPVKVRITKTDKKIIETLQKHGWLSLAEIAKKTGIRYYTIRNALTKLILLGLVVGKFDKSKPLYSVLSGGKYDSLLEKNRCYAFRNIKNI